MGLGLLILGLVIGGVAKYIERKKRKARLARLRESQQDVGVGVRISPSGEDIPAVFGYAGVNAIAAFVGTQKSLVYPTGQVLMPFTDDDDDPYRARFGNLRAFTSTDRFELLVQQYIIGAIGLDYLYTVLVNGDSINSDGSGQTTGNDSQWDNCLHLWGRNAVDWANDISPERETTDIFSGLVPVTGLYRKNAEIQAYGGRPDIFAICRGMRLNEFDDDGPILVHALDGSDEVLVPKFTFSTNAVRGLATFLLSSDIGPDFGNLDWPSFNAAQAIADRKRIGAGSRIRPLSGDPLFVVPESSRYEIGGAIDITRPTQAILNDFLDVMPGAVLHHRLSGKTRIALPDTTKPNAEQSVMSITNDDLLAPPAISIPDKKDISDAVAVKFSNSNLDFAEDTATFTTYKNAPVDVVGVALAWNRGQALNIARSITQESRRASYQFAMTRRGLALEPGDVVRLTVPDFDIDEFVRIEDMRFDRLLQPTITASEFVSSDFSMYDENFMEDLWMESSYANASRIIQKNARKDYIFDEYQDILGYVKDAPFSTSNMATADVTGTSLTNIMATIDFDSPLLRLGKYNSNLTARFNLQHKISEADFDLAVVPIARYPLGIEHVGGLVQSTTSTDNETLDVTMTSSNHGYHLRAFIRAKNDISPLPNQMDLQVEAKYSSPERVCEHDPERNFSLPSSGSWTSVGGGAGTDISGVHGIHNVYALNNTSRKLEAWSERLDSDGLPEFGRYQAEDVSLPFTGTFDDFDYSDSTYIVSGSQRVSAAETLVLLENSQNRLRDQRANNVNRAVSLGSGSWVGVACAEKRVYVLDNTTNFIRGYDRLTTSPYVNFTYTRNSAYDIALGLGNWAGLTAVTKGDGTLSSDDILLALDNTTDKHSKRRAKAWNILTKERREVSDIVFEQDDARKGLGTSREDSRVFTINTTKKIVDGWTAKVLEAPSRNLVPHYDPLKNISTTLEYCCAADRSTAFAIDSGKNIDMYDFTAGTVQRSKQRLSNLGGGSNTWVDMTYTGRITESSTPSVTFREFVLLDSAQKKFFQVDRITTLGSGSISDFLHQTSLDQSKTWKAIVAWREFLWVVETTDNIAHCYKGKTSGSSWRYSLFAESNINLPDLNWETAVATDDILYFVEGKTAHAWNPFDLERDYSRDVLFNESGNDLKGAFTDCRNLYLMDTSKKSYAYSLHI